MDAVASQRMLQLAPPVKRLENCVSKTSPLAESWQGTQAPEGDSWPLQVWKDAMAKRQTEFISMKMANTGRVRFVVWQVTVARVRAKKSTRP